MDTDDSSVFIGASSGLSSLILSCGSADVVLGETGFGGTSETTQEMPIVSTTLVVLVAGGITASIEPGPDAIIEIFTHDEKAYDEIEHRAKILYDRYNASHIKEKDAGATLVVNDPELAQIVSKLMTTMTKKELVSVLTYLQEVLISQDRMDTQKLAKKINDKK